MPRNHGASGYKAGCRCDECREAKRVEAARFRAKFHAEHGRGYYAGRVRLSRPTPKTACRLCGKPVPGSKKIEPAHRTCLRAERRRVDAAKRLARAARGSRSDWSWVVGCCDQCGDKFTRHGAASSFCSKACSKKAGTKFKIGLQRRLAIYERDGWICQLCAEPVDRNLMSTDPLDNWAPSLDHIEPQSWVLIPDHSPANLRLAHRWCNSVRGDLSHYTDADLRVA